MFFVRTASDRDAKVLQDLLHQTWHETYDHIHGFEKIEEICQTWHSLENIKRKIEKRDAEYVVADDGKQIAGMAFANGADQNGVAVLNQIYVRSEFQKQGVGTDLLAEIETCFPDATKMRLEVDKQNLSAINFYKRLGYEEVGTTDDCAGAGQNIEAFIFEKALDY